MAKDNKFIEKPKKGYATRYTSSAPNLDMTKQTSGAYKSRYSASLIPENQSEMKSNRNYKSRYHDK